MAKSHSGKIDAVKVVRNLFQNTYTHDFEIPKEDSNFRKTHLNRTVKFLDRDIGHTNGNGWFNKSLLSERSSKRNHPFLNKDIQKLTKLRQGGLSLPQLSKLAG
jgi:hypothetical protein